MMRSELPDNGMHAQHVNNQQQCWRKQVIWELVLPLGRCFSQANHPAAPCLKGPPRKRL